MCARWADKGVDCVGHCDYSALHLSLQILSYIIGAQSCESLWPTLFGHVYSSLIIPMGVIYVVNEVGEEESVHVLLKLVTEVSLPATVVRQLVAVPTILVGMWVQALPGQLWP